MLRRMCSRKAKADGDGDPSTFFDDLQTCLRLPQCDQLMIIDCCYAAKAFSPEHIGRQKFELLTSVAANAKCVAPKSRGSFTATLNKTLEHLLKANPTGFSVSDLYRELYHRSSNTKPLLFDQSRHHYGQIWLRPQVPEELQKPESDVTYHLNITLKLGKEPEAAVMNELASHLQYLPHIDEVRYEKLYAPREQLANFINSVARTQKLRPLVRKIHAKRELRKSAATTPANIKTPASSWWMKLRPDQRQQSVYDWSSAELEPGRSEFFPRPDNKYSIWPPVHENRPAKTGVLTNQLFSLRYKMDLPEGWGSVCRFAPRLAFPLTLMPEGTVRGTSLVPFSTPSLNKIPEKGDASHLPAFYSSMQLTHTKFRYEIWHVIMWSSALCAVAFFLLHVGEWVQK